MKELTEKQREIIKAARVNYLRDIESPANYKSVAGIAFTVGITEVLTNPERYKLFSIESTKMIVDSKIHGLETINNELWKENESLRKILNQVLSATKSTNPIEDSRGLVYKPEIGVAFINYIERALNRKR